MINLLDLNLQNFLSHINTSLSLKEYNGLVLIEGKTYDGHYSSNGSGKSTLMEGIVYALTGDTLRGVSVNDVINRNHKKNTKVYLKFKKDDDHYEAIRYRKDDIFGDSLVLKKNDTDISKRVNKETQKSLEDILGISYKVLVSTMLLGEGLSSRFTQLSDPEKKSLIESTLSLNYDLSAIKNKASTELSRLKLDKASLEGKLSVLRELSSMDVEEVENSVIESENSAEEAAKELESLKQSLAEEQVARGVLEDKLNILRASLQQYNSLQEEMIRLDREASDYLGELESIEYAEFPHCSMCKQSLKSEDSIQAYKDNHREKISRIHKRMIEIKGQLDNNFPEKEVMEDKYRLLSSELDNIILHMSQSNSTISTISNRYWSEKSRAEKLSQSIQDYKKSLSEIGVLEEEERRVSEDIVRYEYFYKLFSPTGIVVNILSDAIDYINHRLSTYSEILLEKDYKINFIKGKISLQDSSGSSYQSLSNGEKRRLDISIQFALHDYVQIYCGMKLDCCFIDEILDTLDDIGVDNIFDVLRLKLEYCQLKSIYVITHNSKLKDKFDEVITIEKDEKGDSHLA